MAMLFLLLENREYCCRETIRRTHNMNGYSDVYNTVLLSSYVQYNSECFVTTDICRTGSIGI